MASPEYLGSGCDDGTILGRSADDLVSLYDVDPLAQQAAPTAVTTVASTSVSGVCGFTTSEQADAIITAINDIISKLTLLGVWA